MDKILSGIHYIKNSTDLWLTLRKNWRNELVPGKVEEGYKFMGSSILKGSHFHDVKIEWAACAYRSDSTAKGLAGKSMSENPDKWSKGAVYLMDNNYSFAGIGDFPSADVIYVLKPKAESDNPYYLNSEFFYNSSRI